MEFRLLGPLEALSDGRPLPIGGQKQRGVLALLLLACERGRLDRPADRRGLGRAAAEHGRGVAPELHLAPPRRVGREAIERRAPGYRLNVDPERVDALRFERALDAARTLDPPERAAALREALALWRGPPLADVEFSGFGGTEIARIEELRLTALEERIDAELALGRHDAILARSRRSPPASQCASGCGASRCSRSTAPAGSATRCASTRRRGSSWSRSSGSSRRRSCGRSSG